MLGGIDSQSIAKEIMLGGIDSHQQVRGYQVIIVHSHARMHECTNARTHFKRIVYISYIFLQLLFTTTTATTASCYYDDVTTGTIGSYSTTANELQCRPVSNNKNSNAAAAVPAAPLPLFKSSL
jgi:hypothetical protein